MVGSFKIALKDLRAGDNCGMRPRRPLSGPTADGGSAKGGRMERYFGLAEKGSSVRTEVIAGITTFLTMAYIIFVNPDILSAAGMPMQPGDSVKVRWAVADACIYTEWAESDLSKSAGAH